MNTPHTISPPSIFNDVLGPVMRGPSSSHSAAALRIGRLALDLIDGKLERVVVEYDPNGSLVTTHESQGSDLGLFGGLMGWDTDDPRLINYKEEIVKAGIDVDIRYASYGAEHPNNYRLTLFHGERQRSIEAISTGGGMIIVQAIDGIAVNFMGDFHETILTLKLDAPDLINSLSKEKSLEDCQLHQGNDFALLQLSSRAALSTPLIAQLHDHPAVEAVSFLLPVLPVLGKKNLSVPFLSCDDMLTYREQNGGTQSLSDLAACYEAERGGITVAEVRERMGKLVDVFESSISEGLGGTSYDDRILPCQSGGYEEKLKDGQLLPGDVLNRIILYVSSMMEMKSSMGVIVAAPTAGSCGALPGAVFGASDAMGWDRSQRIEAMLTAGLIGVFITSRSTFAAEVAGCMAECGSGSSMAAAAITGLAGGSLEQQLGAASQALQNSFGMTCDTLANRVEAPCLGKNVMAATNALSCANMALANYQHLVPLDQVIEAMRQVGDLMPREICCTGLGGLAITPASRAIEQQLQERQENSPSPSPKTQAS